MTLNDKQQEAIARIRKVIALATNKGATEGEAENASLTVIRLLAMHNLTMDDVEAHKEPGQIMTDGETISEGDDWRAFLAASTARLYFCEYHAEEILPDPDDAATRFKKPKWRHCFSGREHNVIVAREMFVYFVKTVEELARKARTDRVARSEHIRKASDDRKFEQAFRFGCANRLAHRIDEKWFDLSRAPQAQLTAGNKLPALYLQNDQDLSDYMQEKFGNELITQEEAKLPSNFEGLFAGFVAGKNVGLDTQIQQNKAKKIK